MVSDTASLTSFGVNTFVVQGSGQCAAGELVGAVLDGTLLGFGGGGASDFPISLSTDHLNSAL